MNQSFANYLCRTCANPENDLTDIHGTFIDFNDNKIALLEVLNLFCNDVESRMRKAFQTLLNLKDKGGQLGMVIKVTYILSQKLSTA